MRTACWVGARAGSGRPSCRRQNSADPNPIPALTWAQSPASRSSDRTREPKAKTARYSRAPVLHRAERSPRCTDRSGSRRVRAVHAARQGTRCRTALQHCACRRGHRRGRARAPQRLAVPWLPVPGSLPMKTANDAPFAVGSDGSLFLNVTRFEGPVAPDTGPEA